MAVRAELASEIEALHRPLPELTVPTPWDASEPDLLTLHRLVARRGLVSYRLVGELCAYTAPILAAHLEARVGTDLGLDLVGLGFVDVRGASTLLELRHRWADDGHMLVVSNPSAAVCRVVTLMQLEDAIFGDRPVPRPAPGPAAWSS